MAGSLAVVALVGAFRHGVAIRTIMVRIASLS
jgi:hypothetical protein